MRKHILLLLATLPLVTLHSQTIDKVQYRITYKTVFVKDTLKLDSAGNYLYHPEDEMRLDIGSNVSKFYSERREVRTKFLDDVIKHGGEIHDMSKVPPSANIYNIDYYNYPTGKTTQFLNGDGFGAYVVKEPVTVPDWQVTADTCTILGYHCSKAVANYKGRHWTAWYTDDIPLSYGPWQLCGLPGLVLKANDTHNQWVFTAIGLEQIDGKEDISLPADKKKFESTTRAKYYKMCRTTTMDDILQEFKKSSGDDDAVIVGADGKPLSKEDYNKIMKTVSPFNPIDLSE